jgi:TonB family protein
MFLAGIITAGSLLSRPRMSYYSVDLFSSFSSVNPGGSLSAAPAASAAVSGTKTQKAPEQKIPLKDFIRVPGAKARSKETPEASKPAVPGNIPGAQHWWDKTGKNNASSGLGVGAGGMGGSGIVAEGGQTFPYPWYLKSVADKLDRHWHPPHEFQSDTICQVAFVIHRDGNLTESRLEKSSGDSVFDQLALHAVLYSNPLPPLPGGFPEDSLRVHMKFVGKPI